MIGRYNNCIDIGHLIDLVLLGDTGESYGTLLVFVENICSVVANEEVDTAIIGKELSPTVAMHGYYDRTRTMER